MQPQKRKLSLTASLSAQERARYGDGNEIPLYLSGEELHTSNRDRDAHFEQLYTSPSDFRKLARLDPEFAAVYVTCIPYA